MPDEHDKAIAELAAEWLRRAQNDLALSQITDDERIAPEILVYHAQQAAEKAIKALLVKRQVEFPYTHSINTLLSICQTAGIDVPSSVADTHS